MDERTCAIDGCDKPARSSGADWCKMHYHRWYRHGSTDKVATGAVEGKGNGRRYRTTYKPDHPLAPPSGRVYVHRMVLFDVIGPGPHECNWCGTLVDWLPKGDPLELQPDHLNAVGDDNRPENLVPSCRRCNIARGQQGKADRLKAAGWWSNHDTIARLEHGRAQKIQLDAPGL
jgi:hypothetical protein